MAKLTRSEKKRRSILEVISCSKQFYPEFADKFICPTCLEKLDSNRIGDITDGHIIPDAAGGTKTVLLCRKCNSTFGHAQDAAFGDYLQILNTGRKDPFLSRQIPKSFVIDGIKVSGEIVAGEEKIELYIWRNQSNPGNIDKLANKFERRRISRASGEATKSLDLEIKLPLLAQSESIDQGFITAAYLLWFYELGYSWALQSHLQETRDVILGKRPVIKHSVKQLKGKGFASPWIGAGIIESQDVLVCGIADRLVIFPTPTNRAVYDQLNSNFSTTWVLRREDFQVLTFRGMPPARKPMAVLLDKKFLVMPDVVATGSVPKECFFIPNNGSPATILHSISESQFQMAKEKGIVPTKTDGTFDVPTSETGRDATN